MAKYVNYKGTRIPADKETMAHLAKDVEKSETYAHAYYVIMTTIERRQHKRDKETKTIWAAAQTREDAKGLETWAEQHAEKNYNTGMREYHFKTYNVYDDYERYWRAGGKPNVRAIQWQDIRRKFADYMRWQIAASEG